MVSYPHYDNQLFVDGIAQRKYQEYVSDEANKPLLDRAIRGEYPPGSTLKTFLSAAALDEKTITPGTSYTCVGAIQVPDQWDASKGTVHPCWKWESGGHGALDVFNAIEQSCDVYFYNVGAPRQQIENSNDYLHYRDRNLVSGQIGTEKHYFEGLGIQRINDHFEKRFRFGSKTGIELPAEATGVVPDAEWLAKERPGSGWSVSATITVSIGQGDFLTTPPATGGEYRCPRERRSDPQTAAASRREQGGSTRGSRERRGNREPGRGWQNRLHGGNP